MIVGHSERRELFGETDEDVNRKVKAVLAHGMTPIMCVGETLDEREAGGTDAKVTGQVEAGLAGVSREQVGALVIAYEPIWAIGTGRTATASDAQATIATIRAKVQAVHKIHHQILPQPGDDEVVGHARQVGVRQAGQHGGFARELAPSHFRSI